MSRLGREAWAFVLCAAAAGVCAPGCARQPASNAAPVTLRVGVGVPEKDTTGSGLSTLIDLLTTETLVTNGLDGRQAERLARTWSWNPSRTVLTMTLRRDVFFHDGTPLTPDLAVAILRTSIAKREAESFAGVTGVKVTGPDSLEITLGQPDSFFLPDLSVVSVRLPGHPEIGTAAFMLRERTGQHAQLQSFKRYYRGQPAIDAVRIDGYPTQRKAWAAMMRGDLDMLHEVSRDAVEFLEGETTVKIYTSPRTYYIPLLYNLRHAVLKRADVRIALNEAMDKSALVSEGLRGRGRPADGPIWPEHWVYTAGPRPVTYNPEAAKLRLDNAGLPVLPRGNGAMPSRFAFTCIVWAEDPRFERIALVLQKQLAEVGVDMRLEPLRAEAFFERAGKSEYDAAIIEMVGRSLTWVYRFWHSPRDNRPIDTGYRSADETLDRIRQAGTDDEVRAGVAELSRLFTTDPPAAFLAWQTQSRAVSTKFDVAAEPGRDILSNVWQWRPAPEQQAFR